MNRTRIPSRRQKPRRKRPSLFFKPERSAFLDPRSYVTKGGRVRLFGDDMTVLRWQAYKRSQGNGYGSRCECGCGLLAFWTIQVPSPNAGVLAHNEHGSRKSDELDRVKWMRHECHMRSHNCGGKPVPKKAA